MILSLYILIIVMAFSFLTIGLMVSRNKSNKNLQENNDKPIIYNTFLFLALILFFMATYSSFYITIDKCYISNINADHTETEVQYTNEMTCETFAFQEVGLIYFFTGMGLLTFVIIAVVNLSDNFMSMFSRWLK